MFKKIRLLFKNPKSVEELARVCSTPEELNFWMYHKISYKRDINKWNKKDYWQSPEETLSKKNKFGKRSGDCEDFALLAQAVFDRWGKHSTILCVFTQKVGHAVCIFTHRGIWHHISNWGLKQVRQAITLPDIAKAIFSNWRYGYTAQRADNGMPIKLKMIYRNYH